MAYLAAGYGNGTTSLSSSSATSSTNGSKRRKAGGGEVEKLREKKIRGSSFCLFFSFVGVLSIHMVVYLMIIFFLL